MKFCQLLLFVTSFIPVCGQQITTFILVRHAEKMEAGASVDPKDPDLTEVGKQRALKLVAMLRETKIDGIYSTDYKRTRNTVAALATEKGLETRVYQPKDEKILDEILKTSPGGTFVICGHSNTVPLLANYLTGTQTTKDFDDGDYDNVLVVEVTERGKGKVVWFNY